MRRLALLIVLTGCAAPAGGWEQTDDASTPPGDDASTKSDAGSSPDSSAADTGASDVSLLGDANYNTPTVCTSGQYWTLGNTKSASMQPGIACRSCHITLGTAGSKDFDISGTVYPTAHEPDNCNGIGGTMTVVITDANKTDHVLTVNAVGNFYNDDALGFLKIPVPYTAKVVSGTNTRPMITAQTNGDCNSCHTEAGTLSAPGRIMAP